MPAPYPQVNWFVPGRDKDQLSEQLDQTLLFRREGLEGVNLIIDKVRQCAQRPSARIHARILRQVAERGHRLGYPSVALVADRLADMYQALRDHRLDWTEATRRQLLTGLERLGCWLRSPDFGFAEDPTQVLALLPLASQVSSDQTGPEARMNEARELVWQLIELRLPALLGAGDRSQGLAHMQADLHELDQLLARSSSEEAASVAAILAAAVTPLQAEQLGDDQKLGQLVKRIDLCLSGVARALGKSGGQTTASSSQALLALGTVRRVLDLCQAMQKNDNTIP